MRDARTECAARSGRTLNPATTRLVVAPLILLLAAVAPPAAADDGSSPPAPATQESTTPGDHAGDAETTPGSEPKPALKRFQGEVVVTATRNERAVEGLPLSATVIDLEQIERAPTFHTEDLLRGVAGVVLPNGSSETQYPTRNVVTMRGLGGRRALVLLDDIPLLDPMFGHVNWNRLPPEMVERIEVVRGASASLFGSSAMGGTIRLVSRRASPGETATDVSYGSYDTARASLVTGHRLSPSVVLGLGVDAARSDGYNRIPEDQRRPVDTTSDWESRNVRLRADFDAGGGLHGYARASHHAYDLSQGTALSWNERRTSDVAVGVRRDDVAGGELAANAFYVDDQFDVQNVRIDSAGTEASLSGQFDSPSELVGGSLQWSRALSAHLPLMVVGVDLRRMEATTFRRNFDSDGGLASTQRSGGTQDSSGVFAQLSWAPTTSLEVLASARLDWWRNRDGFDISSNGTADAFDANTITEVSPRLAARYAIGPRLGVRGAVYGGFGAPSLADLYRSSAFRGQQNLPNPGLGAETLRGGEVGLDVGVQRAWLEVNLYSNRIEDVISPVLLETDPNLVQQPQNIGTARARGVEVIGTVAVARRWTIRVDYAYSDSTTVDSPGSPKLEGKRIAEVPANAASLRLVYAAPWNGLLSAQASYVDERFADAANLLAYDSHLLVDLYGSWPLADRLEAYLRVANLFDEAYLDDRTPTTRRGAPRQVHAGIRLRLGRPSDDGRGGPR